MRAGWIPKREAIAIDQIQRGVVREELHLRLEMIGEPDVVAVQERQKFSLRPPDRRVPCSRGALVLLLDINNLLKIRRQDFLQIGRIWGTVVHHNDLDILEG